VSENQLRVAFDGDAVLFSDESEQIVKAHGLDMFFEHEKAYENKPLAQVVLGCSQKKPLGERQPTGMLLPLGTSRGWHGERKVGWVSSLVWLRLAPRCRFWGLSGRRGQPTCLALLGLGAWGKG